MGSSEFPDENEVRTACILLPLPLKIVCQQLRLAVLINIHVSRLSVPLFLLLFCCGVCFNSQGEWQSAPKYFSV
jgi:hypothetical protein